MVTITTKEFGLTKEGKKVTAYEMQNDNGAKVRLLDYGATIQSLFVPDRDGKPVDVVLGYDDIASYEEGNSYFGAFVGRYANRIKGGRFVLNGKTYQLELNSENNSNHLHGTFCRTILEGRIEGESVVFHYLSKDMEEGYPGNLDVKVRYTLTENNALVIDYEATTDADTPVNLTNHSYFNLNGQDGSTVREHLLWLNSSAFTEHEPTFVPTGKIIPVEGTPMDFKKEHPIGEHIDDDYKQLRICLGYDHNFILDGKLGEMKPIARVKSEKTGIMMEASTTEPAVQFYSANYTHEDNAKCGKNGIRYPQQGGLCLEAQHYPDSVNHKEFPNTILHPGETYTQKTVYQFKTF